MPVPEAIAAVSSAIGIAKRLKEISKNVADAEFKNLLADLSLELAEVKLKLADFMEENVQLRNELTDLKKQKDEGTPVVKNGVYYKTNGDGPFCTACFDKDGKYMRLKKESDDFPEMGTHSCPVCNQWYSP